MDKVERKVGKKKVIPAAHSVGDWVSLLLVTYLMETSERRPRDLCTSSYSYGTSVSMGSSVSFLSRITNIPYFSG